MANDRISNVSSRQTTKKMQNRLTIVACSIALTAMAGTNQGLAAEITVVSAEERPKPSAERLPPEGTKETTEDAVDWRPIKPGKKLTTRQKRIFVLGLGASKKN